MNQNLKGRGGKGRGQGRKRTAHFRLMHLASCIDDWAEEYRELGRPNPVKQAMLDVFEIRYSGWSAEDMAATGGKQPPTAESFLKTVKTDLRDGRRLSRELHEHLRGWRQKSPGIF
jgi:hypothetical protein